MFEVINKLIKVTTIINFDFFYLVFVRQILLVLVLSKLLQIINICSYFH